jgi:hypothetical protein
MTDDDRLADHAREIVARSLQALNEGLSGAELAGVLFEIGQAVEATAALERRIRRLEGQYEDLGSEPDDGARLPPAPAVKLPPTPLDQGVTDEDLRNAFGPDEAALEESHLSVTEGRYPEDWLE